MRLQSHAEPGITPDEMDGAAPEFREVCLRCRRPKRVCWCAALTQVSSATRVVFIQHPREAKVPISTCRMAHLSLPNSELHVALSASGSARPISRRKNPSHPSCTLAVGREISLRRLPGT